MALADLIQIIIGHRFAWRQVKGMFILKVAGIPELSV